MEEFTKKLIQRLQERVGTTVTIDVKEVTKVNDQKLHTINIMEPDERLSRNYYIEAYYEQYKAGVSVEKIAETILACARDKDVAMEKTGLEMVKNLYEYKLIADNIIFKMIGKERNADYLQDKVYVEQLDFACVFCVLIDQLDCGIATIAVPQSVYETWGLTKEDLYKKALENMEKRFPVVESDIMDILGDIYKIDEDNDFPDFLNHPVIPDVCGLYVASNTDKYNGAAVILYNNMLKSFSEKYGAKRLYIIPSSLHEVIIIPDCMEEWGDIQALNELIVSVNGSHVQPEDILSDHVYVYEYSTDTLTY